MPTSSSNVPSFRNGALIDVMKRFASTCLAGTPCPQSLTNDDDSVRAALFGWGPRHRPYPHGLIELNGYSAYVKFCSECGGKHFMSPNEPGLWDSRPLICAPCVIRLTDAVTASHDQGVYVGTAEKDGKINMGPEYRARCRRCKSWHFLAKPDKRRIRTKDGEGARRKRSATSITRAVESYEPKKAGNLPLIYFCDRCDTKENAAENKKLLKQHIRAAKIVGAGANTFRRKMKESADRAVARHLGVPVSEPEVRKVKRKPREQSSLDISSASFRRKKGE